MVTRQVAAHVPDLPAQRVLDIGCGQGTQVLVLARRGHSVTGLDTSEQLLDDFRAALAAEPENVRERVRLVRGDATALGELFAPASFDAVLCHGVLMYFADPGPLLDAMNAAFEGSAYHNRIGVDARGPIPIGTSRRCFMWLRCGASDSVSGQAGPARA